MKFLIYVLLLGLTGYGAWNYAIQPRFDDSPRALKLRNHQGNQLEVTLLRRDTEHVYFHRKGEFTPCRYPIEQLSLISRIKVRLFPISASSPIQGRVDRSEFNLAQAHLDAMIRDYDDLAARLELLEIEAMSSPAGSRGGAQGGAINRLLARMDGLALKIEHLKHSYPKLEYGGRRFKAMSKEADATDAGGLLPLFKIDDLQWP